MKALLGALCLLAALSAQAGKVLDDEYYSNDISAPLKKPKNAPITTITAALCATTAARHKAFKFRAC